MPVIRAVPAAYRPVLAHRPFRRMMPAFAASDLGDGMSAVAVAWLAVVVAPEGQRELLLGAAVAAYALPGAVGALVLGRWLRGMPPRRLLVLNSSLRAVMLGAIPLAWAAGWLHPLLYVGLLGASSLLMAWGGAGKFALLAQLLPAERRLAGNALLSSMGSASIIVGPAAAGFLATVVSPAWIIGVDALSFAVLGVQAARTAPRADAPAAAPVDAGRSAAGLRLLRGQPELLGILALTWLFFFLYGPVEVALPLHITEDLHADSALLGLYWTLFGVGAVAGGLTAGALRRLPLWPVTLGIVAGWGLVLLPFGTGAGAPVTIVCFALGGAIYGPYSALSFTLFQNRTPEPLLTTVLAARSAMLLTSTPVGVALGGPLVAALGPRAVLAGSGAATVGVAVIVAVVRAVGARAPTPS
ncbi:MFS transporter [Streptomyces sp. NPDC051940]|uniref:MFS transporter n=1 Tax=Streptomyces sp. NPDC051940 TaxID=3155675 RepID=UPI003440E00B